MSLQFDKKKHLSIELKNKLNSSNIFLNASDKSLYLYYQVNSYEENSKINL